MGMPAFVYRWYFRAHSLKSLERNILKFCGIKPIRESLIGMVEGKPAHREKWLGKMRALGRSGRRTSKALPQRSQRSQRLCGGSCVGRASAR